MAISLIRNFIAKEMMKKSKGITSVIPDARKVTFSADHLEKRLIQHGVDLKSIKSEEQLKQILAYVKQAEDKAFTERFGHILKNNIFTKKGDVVDLTGKKIDTSKPIVGGKNVPETEAQIKSKLDAMNKKTVERIKRRRYEAALKAEREKMAKDPDYIQKILDPEDFASGGLAGMLGERTGFDNGGDTTENNWINIVPQYDEHGNLIPIFSKTGKQQIDDAPQGMTSDKEFINFVMSLDIPIDEKTSLLGDLAYGKGRNKIEYQGDEIDLGEGGGKSRKVGIRLWVHWKPLSTRLEEAFAQYAEWGVEGLMVDFLDRDDQEMIDWSEEVLKVAAEHHLRIQFHGAWKPTGRRRTYPNLVNHEGSLNLEYLKWSEDCTPEHNLIVPFTRMLAGPMDYHLGGFLNVLPDAFEARNQHPMVLGTRCHHLAMYVAYENAVPMVCDAPTAYINQPGFDFIQQVPTEWDETRFLDGEVSDFLVIARRKDQDWYIAAMTDSSKRSVNIPLNFLAQPKYHATRWSDHTESNPSELQKNTLTLTSKDTLQINLHSAGGQVLHLTPSPK